MNEWSLKILYDGYDDVFDADWNKLVKICQDFTNFMSSSPLKNVENSECIVTYLENINKLEQKINTFIFLNQSVDAKDGASVNKGNAFKVLYSTLSKPLNQMNNYFATYDNIAELYKQSSLCREYQYLLNNIVIDAKYLLSDSVEEVLAKLDVNGGSAWSNMREYLTSTLEVEYEGQMLPLMNVRNMAFDPSQEVRKRAYEAELKAYEKIKDATAFSLNSIKGQVITASELRGFDSPLKMTLHESKMQQATLDALLSAIKKALPNFRKYLKRKGEILNHPNGLPWYDLFAPLGESNQKFSIDDAQAYLTKHFASFSSDLVDLVNRAFDENWIDFYPKVGKSGGAFCQNIKTVKQSRILTNFTGILSDVVTLAHELGHAYHGYHIENHRPLNYDYSMPVAETASTFNETLIMDAAIKEASGIEKMALIESQLQDLTQVIVDIYSRFLFESAVFEKRKNEFMFADELEQMMLDAQKAAYQDGLDNNTLHPFQWVNKSHYYSAELSFYNFPYAFGGLFARGLFELFKENPKEFVPGYQKMLKASTVNTVEDTAKIMNIDLTTEAFWSKALANVNEQIETFLKLSEEIKK